MAENDELNPPPLLQAWLDVCKESLMRNKSATKSAPELDPLIWRSFTHEFTLDPKSLHELLSLKVQMPSKGHKGKHVLITPHQFQRDLRPEEVHWHGTKVHFLHHNLLTAFLSPSQEVGACMMMMI
jgi:hypothetical protein